LSAVAILLFSAHAAQPLSDRKTIFTDVTQEAGITWRHFSGESPDRFLVETMGGGVAFLDFDNDGLQDILFVNGGETPHGKSPVPVRNALYRNLGNGKFEEVAAKAGVKNAGKWAASAAWFDYDRDGYLDLVVTNYVRFSFDDPKKCEVNGMRSYCEQLAYQGMPLTLYHNNRDGTFTDVSAQSGLGKLVGRALGVVAIDVNDDGWTDLFIARDASPNLLLINKHNGTFEDVAVDAEVAYNEHGAAKAGMGVDAGDANSDGLPDFVVTNFNDQYHSLLVGSKSTVYGDRTVASHLAALTKSYVGWGVKFLDFDNDGNLDLMFMNGHINQAIEATRADVSYQQPPLLLRNTSNGTFQNMRESAGPTFSSAYLGRGLAAGDFDNDGDLDVAFTRLNGAPVLLRNNVGQQNSWIGFELQGTSSNRDAIGAKITVTSGDRRLVRWITGGSSYLSAHDRRVVVGLGADSAGKSVNLEIQWPRGRVQRLSNLGLGRYHKIVEPGQD